MPETITTTRFFITGSGTSVASYTKSEVDNLVALVVVSAGGTVPAGESRYFEGRQLLNTTSDNIVAMRDENGQLPDGLEDITEPAGMVVTDYSDAVNTFADLSTTPLPEGQLDYRRYVAEQHLVYTTIDGGVTWTTTGISRQRPGTTAPDRPSEELAQAGQVHFTLDGGYSVNAPEGWTTVSAAP